MPDVTYLTIPTLSARNIERIFSKIEVDPITDCWNWTGAMFPHGYGSICWKGRTEYVHRVMFAWLIEPLRRHPHKGKRKSIPSLDHLCRNRRCVNPAHLELTSQRINILRGVGPCAINSKKTFCPYGHPLEVRGNRRFCRTCANASARKRYNDNSKRYIEKTMKWRSTNSERYKATAKEWREKNPEYGKNWHKARKNQCSSP